MKLIRNFLPKKSFYSTSSSSKKRNLLVVSSIGNPEPQYANTRHNIGHLINNHLPHSQFNSLSQLPKTEVAVSRQFKNLIFTKSLTYMNLSGESIIPSWLYYQKKFQQDYNVSFLVLHDELSKSVGKHQLRYGGNEVSSRGHNGLKSIVDHNKHGFKFFRLGVGISRPTSRNKGDVADYVMGKVSEQESNMILFEVLPKIEEIIENFVE